MADLIRVLVVQPYVPAYRVPLFREMRHRMRSRGFELVLASGQSSTDDRARGDDAAQQEADVVMRQRRFTMGAKVVLHREVAPVLREFTPDLIIVEQAIKNLETYEILLHRARHRHVQVAMWGQGRSYSTRQSPVEAWAKQRLTQRADWFFAYTDAGARHVVEQGFARGRVTVLQNTIDAEALRADLDSVTDEQLASFRTRHGLTEGRSALFLGGLDARKGLDFLVDAAVEIEARLPGFRLLVGGAGSDSTRLEQAVHEGAPLCLLGRVEGASKAVALRAADVLLIPEWIGLVAVDSLVSGCPIVTTRHPSHSPEEEYLASGRTAVYTAHDLTVYADATAELLHDRPRLDELAAACRADGATMSIEAMADRFVGGIEAWWNSR